MVSTNEEAVFGRLRVFDKRIFIFFFQNGVAAGHPSFASSSFQHEEDSFQGHSPKKTFKPSQTANHNRVYFINFIGKYNKQIK